jgi:coenzyme F420-reducing hydrogenase alpha subunit
MKTAGVSHLEMAKIRVSIWQLRFHVSTHLMAWQRRATHWARLIELLYAAERWVELATDSEITSADIYTKPTQTPTEGVGIVGTTNNYVPIQMSTNKAARSLIKMAM